jgi:antirestriction protein ArdC
MKNTTKTTGNKTMRKFKKKAQVDIYKHTSDMILEAMEQHGTDWCKPWKNTAMGGTLRNAITGHCYRGLNIFLLSHAIQVNGWTSGEFMTYNQAVAKGYQVKKGEKGSPITWFNMVKIKTEDKHGEEIERTIPNLKYHYVFNADQVEGYEGKALKKTDTKPEAFNSEYMVEDAVKATGASIVHGGNKACYIPSLDRIKMPEKESFINTNYDTAEEAYYGTLLHELTHWTAHEKRLARDLSGRFGDNSYAFEELVAEIGSVFLCSMLGVKSEPSPANAQYLNHWMEVIKKDKKAIVKAFGLAQKASDFVLGIEYKQEEKLVA